MRLKLNDLLLVLAILLSFSCSEKKTVSLKPAGIDTVSSFSAEVGDIKAVFTDNSEMAPVHRKGYNGIAELYHKEQDSNVFVPSYAGFNIEHIFSGDTLVQFFEPRTNPMILYRKSSTEVWLYQETTPVSGVESLTEFKLVAPYYIDITFRCIIHDMKYFRHDYAGIFWASYINNPPDIKVYFPGTPEGSKQEEWVAGYSPAHGVKSTHRDVNDNYQFYFDPAFKATLANNFSDYRYTQPFYFGHFHNMALAYFFDSGEIIRLSQSPTGGGKTNPAWDFQYLIPKPVAEKEYSFRARIMYKPFTDNEEVRREYEKWIKG